MSILSELLLSRSTQENEIFVQERERERESRSQNLDLLFVMMIIAISFCVGPRGLGKCILYYVLKLAFLLIRLD